MIKYKLFCKECDLKFDSWFASSNEYERLKKKKLLNCHNCNSVNIETFTGNKNFTAYTMDLTKKYIEINADYRS